MKNKTKEEIKLINAVNFLLYSYFAVTLGSDSEEILETAIHKAYLDATQQGAYNALLKTTRQKVLSKEAHEKGKEILSRNIKLLCGYDSDQSKTQYTEYSLWHSHLCNELISSYKECLESEDLFTYGNAQKWVNMTLKYLYMLYSIFSEFPKTADDETGSDYCDRIGRHIYALSDQLHIPVDSYIIEAVWNLEGDTDVTESRLPLIKEKLCRDGHRGTYTSDKVKPWSKWQQKEYERLQSQLKETVHAAPLDWEEPVWTEVARRRKGQTTA